MAKNNKEIDKSLSLIAKSSVVVFIGIFISKLAFYLYRVIIARHFGPEDYGLFSLAVMILNLFVVLSMLGLSEGLVRFVSFYRGKKQTDRISYLLKFSKKFLIFSSILSALLLFFLSSIISKSIFHDSNLIIFLQISSIIIPFWVFSNVYLSVIRAFEKISMYSFIANILQSVVKLAVLVLLVILGFKSNSIMSSYFIGTVVIFIVSDYICKKRFSELFKNYALKKEAKNKIRKELLSYSLPLMFSNILLIVYYWVDSFILGYFKGTYEVGIYNAAVPIVILFGVIPDLFIQLFYPLVTKEFSRKNFELVKEVSKQVAKWIFILVLPLFLIVFIFPGAVINLLFGKEYLSAVTALRILSFGGFISIFIGFLTTLLSMAGKSKTIFINMIATSLINLVLNIILVPRYGLNGAAVSTTIMWVIFTFILFYEVNKAINFVPLRRKMLRILLVSLIPTSLLLLVKSFFAINMVTLILLGVFFFLVYFISIFITGCLDSNDLMIFVSFKRKLFAFKEILVRAE